MAHMITERQRSSSPMGKAEELVQDLEDAENTLMGVLEETPGMSQDAYVHIEQAIDEIRKQQKVAEAALEKLKDEPEPPEPAKVLPLKKAKR